MPEDLNIFMSKEILPTKLELWSKYGVELVAMLHEKNLSYSSQSTWYDWAVYTQEEHVWLPHNFK